MRSRCFRLILILLVSLTEVTAIEHNDENCSEQLQSFREAISAQELWAFRLLDLWGKIESGYFVGARYSFGRFNECLNFTQSTKKVGIVQGQYCLVQWRSSTITREENSTDIGELLRSLKLTLSNGICLPATCSKDKVLDFLNFYLHKEDLEAFDARCLTRDPLPFDSIDVIAMSMSSIFGALLLASTVYDIIINRSKGREANKLLIAFSIYTNGKKLFRIHRQKPSKAIDCLEGLRCISLFSVVLAHRVLFQYKFPITNPIESKDWVKHYWFLGLAWSLYAVDTFLVIGGFLSAFQLLRAFEAKKFNAPVMIFHRWLRYTPLLAAAMVIFMSLHRHLKSPYPDIEGTDDCYSFWWSALFHIQNYVNPKNLCLSHSWYLSVDFQLFIISPLLIYPARKYGWKFVWSLPALAVASSIFVMMTCIANEFLPLQKNDEVIAMVNNPTHARMAPWLIGMVLGYILFQTKDREVKVNKFLVLLLWIVSFVLMAVNIALLYPVIQFEKTSITVMENAILKGFSRLVWSFPIVWIIFACYKLKSGGIIRWVLSLREWQPIGRMSLSIYITHLLYQRLTLMNAKMPSTNEFLPTFCNFLGDIGASFILGTIFSLTFEAPFVQIERFILDRPQKKIYKLSDVKMIEKKKDQDVAF